MSTAGYDDRLAAYSPLGWWKLDDPADSTTAADSGSLDHGLTASGTVTFGVTGPVPGDTAALFDGSTGYLVTASNYATPPLGTSVTTGTLIGWFSTSSTGAGRHVALLVNDDSNYLTIQSAAGAAILASITASGASASVTSGSTYADGAWHMAALSFSGGTMTLYIDGVSAGSQSFTAPSFADGDAYINVGNWTAAGGFWDGDLAQVALLSAALTAAQVSDLFGGGGTTAGTGAMPVAVLLAAGII